MGHATLIEGMIHDGLWDPYRTSTWARAAHKCGRRDKVLVAREDEYAKESVRRALAAQKEGMFDSRDHAGRDAAERAIRFVVKLDEGPAKATRRSSTGYAAFAKDGTDHRGETA